MKVELLHNTPLYIASKAIRKCWASEDKSDTMMYNELPPSEQSCGTKDKELIHRVGNKNKHASTLEHINYTFDIDGISRACLQELARHRHASMSVKSTRYTLKELKEARDDTIMDFVIEQPHNMNNYLFRQLKEIRAELALGTPNDKVKYMLPEAYKTSLVWTINMRSLQNFLALRTNKAALWEIRDLANEIYTQLPEDHKYMFTEFLYEEK